jgi:hypothetical protein
MLLPPKNLLNTPYLQAFLEISSIFRSAFSTSSKSSQTRWIQHETVVCDRSKKTLWDDLKMKKPRTTYRNAIVS